MKNRPVFITQSGAITLPKAFRQVHNLEAGICFDYKILKNGTIVLTRKECCPKPGTCTICAAATNSKKN